jgi:hypothetical protein
MAVAVTPKACAAAGRKPWRITFALCSIRRW